MKMFKVIFTILIFFMALSAKPAAISAEEIKLGYIDLANTFDGYEKTKDNDKSLAKKGEAKEKERQKLVDEIKNLKEEIALLSKKGRDEKQPVIDEKIKNLQEFDKEARDELKEERDGMVRDLLREIDKVVKDYGKKHGYTAILNGRAIVYGNEAVDITEDIIDNLNKGYKKK